MADPKLVDPLAWNVPITDSGGLPTLEFQRKWAQQHFVNNAVPNVSGIGFLVYDGSTYDLRSIVAGTAIVVTNGNGTGGNAIITHGNTAVAPGSYGGAATVATLTVDQQGHLTAAGNVSILINEGGLSLGNNTTNDVSTSRHGFTPRLSGTATTFLDGTGNYTVPASGGNVTSTAYTYTDPAAITIVKPAAASFTLAATSGGGTGVPTKADLATRGITINTPYGTGALTNSLTYVAVPGATPWTATGFFQPNATEQGNWFWGIGIRDSTGKIHAFGIRNNSGGSFGEQRWTNINTFNTGNPFNNNGFNALARPLWLRVLNNATNFVFTASHNGEIFYPVGSLAIGTFLGATLNDVGIFVDNSAAVNGIAFYLDCYSWTVL